MPKHLDYTTYRQQRRADVVAKSLETMDWMDTIDPYGQEGRTDNLTSNQLAGGSSPSGCADNTPSDRGISLLMACIRHKSTC